MSDDLGLLLEELLLDYIRVAGIFFVGGIALFNFTDLGKEFAIISFLIAFILIIASLVEYYFERKKLSEMDIYPKNISDILAYVMIGIAILIVWVIYVVWYSKQTTLQSIVKEIEREVDITNAQLMRNLQQLDEKLSKKFSLAEPLMSTTQMLGEKKKYSGILKTAKTQDDLIKISSLAAVS